MKPDSGQATEFHDVPESLRTFETSDASVIPLSETRREALLHEITAYGCGPHKVQWFRRSFVPVPVPVPEPELRLGRTTCGQMPSKQAWGTAKVAFVLKQSGSGTGTKRFVNLCPVRGLPEAAGSASDFPARDYFTFAMVGWATKAQHNNIEYRTRNDEFRREEQNR